MQVVPFSPDCVGVIPLSCFRKRKKYIRESHNECRMIHVYVDRETYVDLLTEREEWRDVTHASELDDDTFI